MRSSILFRLYCLIGLAVAPAFALLVYNHAVLVESREAAADAEALRYARMISDETSRLIEGARGLMLAASVAPVVIGRQEPACGQYLQRLVDIIPSTTSISIFNLDGAESCRAVGALSNVRDRAYFQNVLRTGEFTVGEYIFGRTSRMAVMPIAAPLRDEGGAITGVVATTIKLDWLRAYFQRKAEDLPAQTAITIADNSGRLLIRLPATLEAGTPLRVFPIIQRSNGDGNLRTEAGEAFDGTARFVGFTRSTEGLYIIVGIPRETVLAGLNESSLRNLLLMLAVALIAILGCPYWRPALFHTSRAGASRGCQSMARRQSGGAGQIDVVRRAGGTRQRL